MVNFVGNGSKSLHVSVEASLEKLQTDYIDLLYVHWWDHSASIPELMQSLNHLVASGKVLYLGISDPPAWVVSKANEYAHNNGLRQFSVYQGRWNAAARDFEREIVPMARAEGMALAPWSSLGGGNFRTAEQLEQKKEGRNVEPGENGIKVSKALEAVAKRRHTAITSIAQAYVTSKAPHVFPIVGGRSVEHPKANIEAPTIKPSDVEIEQIENAVPFDPGFPQPSSMATRSLTTLAKYGSWSIRDSNVNAPPGRLSCRRLVRTGYDEFSRAVVSLLVLQWIHNDQYGPSVRTQPERVRFTRQSFDWIRARVDEALCDAADHNTPIICVVIDDLGRISRLTTMSRQAVTSPPLLTMRFYWRPREINFGQLTQADLAPAWLRSLQNAKLDRHALNLHFAEQLLDIAGASVTLQAIPSKLGTQQGFEQVLTRRALLLHTKGFRLLSVNGPQEGVPIRLPCMAMLRFSSHTLRPSTLRAGHRTGGTANYLPALLVGAVDNNRGWGRRDMCSGALKSALRDLARVTGVLPGEWPGDLVLVLERNVLGVLKVVLQAQEYLHNLSILEKATVPEVVLVISERSKPYTSQQWPAYRVRTGE
ncbi:hypothetical protein DL769_008940 [Monosporascus sp. CRB-8-3]|nr:hypothetical protein DL769_008940 [Monosporascus sp. CRB-8-3]